MVMTAAPLAMKMCGLQLSDSNLGLQWHVLGMYVPRLLHRRPHRPLRRDADRLRSAWRSKSPRPSSTCPARRSGISGPGGAARRRLELRLHRRFVDDRRLHRPQGRTKVQSFNDFIIFGTMAVAPAPPGRCWPEGGWNMVNWIVFPLAATAGVGTLWSRGPAPRQRVPAAEKAKWRLSALALRTHCGHNSFLAKRATLASFNRREAQGRPPDNRPIKKHRQCRDSLADHSRRTSVRPLRGSSRSRKSCRRTPATNDAGDRQPRSPKAQTYLNRQYTTIAIVVVVGSSSRSASCCPGRSPSAS